MIKIQSVRPTSFFASILGGILAVLLSGPSLAAPTATYLFNNTLAAQESGVAALMAVDPLGTNGFVSDTLYGQTRTVYAFNGNASPPAEEGGLSLDTTGLVSGNNYSVEMVFQFTQSDNAWRRIVDVQNRQSDNGFYVDNSNKLNVYPFDSGGDSFTNNTYHHVVLVDSAGVASAYLDGTLSFSVAIGVMDINNADNPGNLMNFFLDNTIDSGNWEYSSGRVGLVRLYAGALTAVEVAQLAANPFGQAPEPSTIVLMAAGLAGMGLKFRKT